MEQTNPDGAWLVLGTDRTETEPVPISIIGSPPLYRVCFTPARGGKLRLVFINRPTDQREWRAWTPSTDNLSWSTEVPTRPGWYLTRVLGDTNQDNWARWTIYVDPEGQLRATADANHTYALNDFVDTNEWASVLDGTRQASGGECVGRIVRLLSSFAGRTSWTRPR